MTTKPPHSTLREWRTSLTRPVYWAMCAGVAAALTILAPFGTAGLLRAPFAFAYWLAMAGATYAVGDLTVRLVADWGAQRLSRPVLALVAALAAGVAILPVVAVLNLLAFNYWPGAADWPLLAAQIIALSAIVTGMAQLLVAQLAAPSTAAAAGSDGPRLLQRLPLQRRGSILSLSAEDHYTRIRTDKGEAMVLLRLSDAITEAAPVPGLQVHRSHWVAMSAIAGVRRNGDGAMISLHGQGEIPVSRRYIPDLRRAGLLPN